MAVLQVHKEYQWLLLQETHYYEKKLMSRSFVFPILNIFENYNLINYSQIVLGECKLKKLQVGWYQIWKGCKLYGRLISAVIEAKHYE
jgi:hypothetical protein